MFRSLLLFPTGQTEAIMEAPLAATMIDGPENKEPRKLSIAQEAIFTTAVGHSSKRTLASWHVTTSQEVVEHLLEVARDAYPLSTPGEI